MKIEAKSVADYLKQLPDDRQKAMKKLRSVIKKKFAQRVQRTIELRDAGMDRPAFQIP
jgi:cephalosporin-C deacetylase-like acetyl esterase